LHLGGTNERGRTKRERRIVITMWKSGDIFFFFSWTSREEEEIFFVALGSPKEAKSCLHPQGSRARGGEIDPRAAAGVGKRRVHVKKKSSL